MISMTGFGEGRRQRDGLSVAAEVRTVNNRHLRVSVRGPDAYVSMESEVEKAVRRHVRRGTVQVQFRVQRDKPARRARVNAAALIDYLNQFKAASEAAAMPEALAHLSAGVLSLPGVIEEDRGEEPTGLDPAEWADASAALEDALSVMAGVRRAEGAAMARKLHEYRRRIADELALIEQAVPRMVEDYRGRLRERVAAALREADVELRPGDLIREVALFAERGDVSEEVTRLHSHLDQFAEVLAGDEEDDSAGRKLEFIGQEMTREVNTVGSKSQDVEITVRVVHIKATLEKVRELIQNIE